MAASAETPVFGGQAVHEPVFGERYLSDQPTYPKDFYKLIYDYHASKWDSYETALDVGMGPGQIAAELSNRFDQVIATDVKPAHVNTAEDRLLQLVASKILKVRRCSGEQINQTVPPGLR